MLISLLRFEASYQLKQKAFIGFIIIFLAFGFILGSQGNGLAKVNLNSAYQISYNIALLSLGCEFAIMFFVISGVLRDKQYRMEAIMYSTSIKKNHFFISRFLGVLLFSLLVFTMTLVGFALGTYMPGLDPERLTSFHLDYYLWTWLLIVLPNVFICTAFVFSVSAFSKNNIATYISAITIYALYWICSIFFNSPLLAAATPASPENMIIAALADPFGISAFFEQTQYWTPFEKNTRLLSFSGNFLWNRIFWVSISLVVLKITYTYFSFKKLKQKSKRAILIEEKEIVKKAYKPIYTITATIKAHVASFKSLLRIELTNVFKSLPFIAIILIWIVIVVTEIYSRVNQGGAYNDSLYPTTDLLIWLIKDPLPFLGLLLIVFYSGELVWRERSLQFSGIIDATPASNMVFFLSKAITLILLPVILIAISILIAIGIQITKGYYIFEIWQYLSMFYYSGMTFLFYILLALFIQSLSPNKYAGMAITGLIIIFFGSSLASLIGIEHPLLRIGSFPAIEYTNMTGYGDYTKPFHYYAMHWTTLGLILMLLSFKLWQRGTTHKFAFRLKQLRYHWKKWQLTTLVFFGIVFITSGATIYYNRNIINEYVTVSDNLDFRETYEKKYKKYDVPRQLVPVAIKTKVDIYPDENFYTIKADYILENRGEKALQEFFIYERIPVTNMSIENAILQKHDSVYDIRIFRFEEPLAPGEQIKYTYELTYQKKGFETSTILVNNGSFIQHSNFEPILGYTTSFEITDSFEREKRGLPKQIEDENNASHFSAVDASYVKLPYETVVSTQKDQTAIATGELIKSWHENDRNFYHYKSSHDIIPFLAYYSGAYEIEKENYKGVEIEQYYHPGHEYNINTISKSTRQTLDYCQKHFIDYKFDHIRIAEIPGHWRFGGQAQPGTIAMVEDRLYLTDNRNTDNFDLVAKRTIHEVAHQWWGHMLTPKNVDGGGLITEGLTKYTEAVIMEKYYGKKAIWQLSKSANTRYFSGRSYATDPEPPLYLGEGQSYLLYGKSYVSLLALKDLIGEHKMNEAMRRLAIKYKDEKESKVTSTELLNEFYAVTPEEYHILIDDWFKRIITYDLKIENAEVTALTNGKYEVTIDIFAKRFETKENGEAVAISIDEPIQLGMFSKDPSTIDNQDSIVYLKPHQINANQMQFKLLVDEIPQYISIDPFGTRLDANNVDNTKRPVSK
ncbi:ABC transporter permease/M1 family aminopeptidase [Aquimarina macrocephali]|uniref:ABC transporter permease/M1 family aminopeptidase n=1 Tax=Aquimarina macrocephali TaxID=666563 RepID=UPI0004675CF6|nr:M1 family aminopeptidase [Aquimarina macrocephali]